MDSILEDASTLLAHTLHQMRSGSARDCGFSYQLPKHSDLTSKQHYLHYVYDGAIPDLNTTTALHVLLNSPR